MARSRQRLRIRRGVRHQAAAGLGLHLADMDTRSLVADQGLQFKIEYQGESGAGEDHSITVKAAENT